MWKACNEILPIKGNLYRRGITSDARCRICELEVEIVGHSLWSCTFTRDVWLESPPWIQKCMTYEDTFMNIFLKLHDRLGEGDMQLIATIAREIWLRRNKFVFDGIFTPSTVIRSAKDQVEGFAAANQN
jgi:hypothetical protein